MRRNNTSNSTWDCWYLLWDIFYLSFVSRRTNKYDVTSINKQFQLDLPLRNFATNFLCTCVCMCVSVRSCVCLCELTYWNAKQANDSVSDSHFMVTNTKFPLKSHGTKVKRKENWCNNRIKRSGGGEIEKKTGKEKWILSSRTWRMYVEAGGTRIEGSMFQILNNAMIETEGNLMRNA
jgi:hypothetical protein